MNQSNSPLAPHSILGAFEIIEFIAAGGMGSVYKARNRISGDVRALKIILPALASDPVFVSRFVREIKAASTVEHPNLVRVFEPAMHGDMMFLPMEMLQGETLSVRLRRQRRLDVQDTLALLLPTASAIAAVHARGIIHRDLKPTNIFLAIDAAGVITPKVLDFGAARTSDVHDDNTATGIVIGSPPYMSYEQASGIKDIDPRVDQYALGVIAYQLLSGARPYENDDTGLALAKILQGRPFPTLRALNPEVPPALEAAILRAMARDRNDRFRDVAEFSEAMRTSVDPGTIVLTMKPLLHPPPPSAPRMQGLSPTSVQNPQLASAPSLPLPPVEAQSGSTMARSSVQIPAPAAPSSSSSLVAPLLAVIVLLAAALVAIGVRAYTTRALHATAHVADPPQISAVSTATAAPMVTGLHPPIMTSATALTIASAAPSASATPPRSHSQSTSTSHSQSTSTSHSTNASAPCIPRPGVPCL